MPGAPAPGARRRICPWRCGRTSQATGGRRGRELRRRLRSYSSCRCATRRRTVPAPWTRDVCAQGVLRESASASLDDSLAKPSMLLLGCLAYWFACSMRLLPFFLKQEANTKPKTHTHKSHVNNSWSLGAQDTSRQTRHPHNVRPCLDPSRLPTLPQTTGMAHGH